MESLAGFRGTRAEWLQPQVRARRYELKSGETHLATLVFPSVWNTQAEAESAEGAWVLKRSGLLKKRITVRAAGQATDAVEFTSRFGGDGTAHFADGGRTFEWKPAGKWSNEWAFADEQGRTVLHFHEGREQKKLSDVLKVQSSVDLVDVAESRDCLPILLALGIYLMILARKDAVAESAGAAD